MCVVRADVLRVCVCVCVCGESSAEVQCPLDADVVKAPLATSCKQQAYPCFGALSSRLYSV